MQDFTVALAELHLVPLPRPRGSAAQLSSVSATPPTPFYIISTLAEGALCPFMQVIDKYVKRRNWSFPSLQTSRSCHLVSFHWRVCHPLMFFLCCYWNEELFWGDFCFAAHLFTPLFNTWKTGCEISGIHLKCAYPVRSDIFLGWRLDIYYFETAFFMICWVRTFLPAPLKTWSWENRQNVWGQIS